MHEEQPHEEPTSARADTFNNFLTDMSGMAQELTANIRASFGKALEQSMKNLKGNAHPLLDIYETADSLVVITSPLLGLVQGSLEVSMNNNILTIKGETRLDAEIPPEAYLRKERYFGTFWREVELARPVQAGAARAKLRDHILTITLPKAETAQVINVKQGD